MASDAHYTAATNTHVCVNSTSSTVSWKHGEQNLREWFVDRQTIILTEVITAAWTGIDLSLEGSLDTALQYQHTVRW